MSPSATQDRAVRLAGELIDLLRASEERDVLRLLADAQEDGLPGDRHARSWLRAAHQCLTHDDRPGALRCLENVVEPV